MDEIDITKPIRHVGNLRLANTRLIARSGNPSAYVFTSNTVATVKLKTPVAAGAAIIELDTASEVEPGQLLYFSTQSPVDKSYNYKKTAVAIVSAVAGNLVTLNRQLHFHFDTAETTVAISEPARVEFDNVEFVVTPGKRFDFRRLSGVQFRNCRIVSQRDLSADGLFIGDSANVWIENATIDGGRYPIQITNGTYNTHVRNLWAENTWHPIDASAWAADVFVDNAAGANMQQLVQCHPSFNVWFRNCSDVMSRDSEAIFLRCIGGGLENCHLISPKPASRIGISGPWLHPRYVYLADNAERIYRNVTTTDYLSASFCRRMIVENCNAAGVFIDGHAFNVGELEWRGVNTVGVTSTRRVQVKAEGNPVVAGYLAEDGVYEIDRRSMANVGHWRFEFEAPKAFRLGLFDIWEPRHRTFQLEGFQPAILRCDTKTQQVDVEAEIDWLAATLERRDGRLWLSCQSQHSGTFKLQEIRKK